MSAVAVNGDRFIQKALAHEPRYNHSILPRLSWTNGVENPSNHNGEPLLLEIGFSQKLVDDLRGSVTPAGPRGWAENKIIRLAEHRPVQFPVDLHGPIQESLSLFKQTGTEAEATTKCQALTWQVERSTAARLLWSAGSRWAACTHASEARERLNAQVSRRRRFSWLA